MLYNSQILDKLCKELKIDKHKRLYLTQLTVVFYDVICGSLLTCNGVGLGPTLFVRLVSCECISFGLVVCYSHPKTVCELTYKSRSTSRLTTLKHIKVKSLDGVHTYQTVSLSENVSAYHFRLRIKHSTHKH